MNKKMKEFSEKLNYMENEKLKALLKKWRQEVHVDIRMTE